MNLIHQFIANEAANYLVVELCRMLGVSRRGTPWNVLFYPSERKAFGPGFGFFAAQIAGFLRGEMGKCAAKDPKI